MRFCKVFLSVLLVATLAVSLVACKPAATEPVTYTVTFDYNYDGAPAPYTVEVEEGDRATKPADPDRPDYTFKGWFVDKECLIEETFLSSGVTQSPINKITADTTFYAGWRKKVAKAELVSVTAVYVGKPVELNAPLNTSFVSVTATYSDQTTKKVSEFEVSTLDSSTIGVKTLTVTYTEDGITKTCTFSVEVVDSTAPQPGGDTIYFKSEDGWTTVNVYTYEPELIGGWPGEPMTAVDGQDGWFYYSFEEGMTPNKLIFNNGTAQTGNLTYDGENNYYAYNDLTGAGQWGADFTVQAPAVAPTYRLYFYNTNGWATVNAYAWTGRLKYTGEWPGTAMTADTENNGWYYIDVNQNAVNVIFNDGTIQTDNLEIDGVNNYYVYGDKWYPTMPCIHEYSGDCDATCNKCGAVRETTAEHTYDNDCDADCNVCGEVRAVEHRYEVKYDETNHWEECEICLSVKADSTQPHKFTMQHNSTHHWNECECGYVDESSREEHTYVDGFCTVCRAEQPEVPVVLESIEVTFTTQGVVFVNTEITASNFKVTKVMSNGDKQPVSDKENVSVALEAGSTNEVEGTAIYVVTYQGKTAEVEVTFTRELTGITAVATETTVEYEGTLELTVTANYDGAASATVTDYTTDFDNTTTGLQTVTVTYTENDITETTTVEVTVNELPKTTYYFYNADGWASVYAYAWMEEAVPVTPATGDFVIMGDIGLGEAWTTEGSVKLFYNESANQYEFKGLRLSAGMQFKIVQLGETGHTYYNTLEQQHVDASLYTYSSDGNIVIAKDGIYDFYFKADTQLLYFGTGTTESTPNMQVTSVTLTETWPGTAMTAVEGQDGWYSISVDERAQKIIFSENGDNQTANLDLNAETPYYNGTEWVATIG